MNPLPSRRPNVTHEATIGGVKVFLTLGFREDGQVGELFVDVEMREEDTTRSWASCWSRAVSIALQHGVPLAEFVEHFRWSEFQPSGPVRPPVLEIVNPMRIARSIPDWVMAVVEKETP